MLRSTYDTTVCSWQHTGGWGEGNSLEAGKVQNLVPPGRIFVHGHKRLVYKGNHSKGSKFQFQSWKITVIRNLNFQKFGHRTSKGTHCYFYFLNSSMQIYGCVHAYVCVLSCVHLFVTPWTIAAQAPLSMEFFRQDYWSELLFPGPTSDCIHISCASCTGRCIFYYHTTMVPS